VSGVAHIFGADRMSAHRRCGEEACGERLVATRLAATKLMLVRSILLDMGKLLDGSFALGGATSVQIHAARAIRLRLACGCRV
jgi:hypothetical protein